uniref:CUE domain-containing protein n=1 Tax=Echinostoma caproni TaxID=27848 RepID=A0A183B6H2_9TREM
LVHEGMGRAERIIKAVMLPVGSPPAAGQPNPAEPAFASSTSFVMGPVDPQSAEVFLTSYKQLLPDASPSDLQKVLEMKGVKYGELQMIVDIFRGQLDASRDAKSTNSASALDQQSGSKKDEAECKTGPSDLVTGDDSPRSRTLPSTETQAQGNLIKPLEKLVKKKR